MLRSTVTSIVALAFFTTGCASNNRATLAVGEEPYQPKYSSLDSYDAPTADSPTPATANDPYSEPAPAYANAYSPTTDSGAAPAYAAPAGGEMLSASFGRTHLVAKGDTLIKLSRYYYGNDSGWKGIWEANRNRVPNPNQLAVGTNLIIP